MGHLKPGAKYVYERVGGTTYSREWGADPSTRKEVGWEYDPVVFHGPERHRDLRKEMQISQLWHQIWQEAKTNITLQKALDRAIMIYKLSKDKL